MVISMYFWWIHLVYNLEWMVDQHHSQEVHKSKFCTRREKGRETCMCYGALIYSITGVPSINLFYGQSKDYVGVLMVSKLVAFLSDMPKFSPFSIPNTLSLRSLF